MRDESGNVIAEFALIGLLFFFLIGVAIQGAILFSAWLIITNLTDEGARYAAPCYQRPVQACTTTDVQNYVYSQGARLVDETQLAITVTPGTGVITVSANYQAPLLVPFINGILPNPTTLVAASTMRLENGGS
jgi:Flp pilus assembly protein TadG